MEKINELINFLKSVEINTYIDLLIALVVIVCVLIFSLPISYRIIKAFYKDKDKTKKSKTENKQKIRKSSIYKSLVIILDVTGIFIGTKIMDLTPAQDEFCNRVYRIFIIWLVATLISAAFESREQILDKTNLPINIKQNSIVMNMLGKILKIFLYIIAAYLSFKEFGYDLGGLATGIGVGSAVLALALQDLVKETFAGIILFLDRPFDIGDWITVNDVSGSVEDINLRSTKLRTMSDTLVTISNDNIISKNVTNWGKIQKRVYETNLNLPLETKEVTIEKLTNRIRFILKYNKDIDPDSVIVDFNAIRETGININIWANTKIVDYGAYLEFCHKTNLTIYNILESQGVKLAYPGSNIYIKENKLPKEFFENKKLEKNDSEKNSQKKNNK